MGLRSSPGLVGNVVVKFVIARSGEVITAADGGSSLPDASVVACIVRACGSMSFPQPENGLVTVRAEITLTQE
jgi:Ca-activated chloride channel family protein